MGGHRNFVGVIVISLLVLLALVLCVLFSRWAKPFRKFCRRENRRRSQVPTVLLQGPGGGDAEELRFDDGKDEGNESPRTDSGFASPGSEKVRFEVSEISQNTHPTRPKKAFQLPWSRK
ncbi:hypothetical protein EWM64_g6944 [Hericium alpestre]|uniref:Uncharacterized protein n=1 Tax=Hericium alpestre TaxID=135208 RepID=A0A4Y9ZS61_9AGAM|nr:hypothetical protein EWM64_g6944 [Hericium alpestre]